MTSGKTEESSSPQPPDNGCLVLEGQVRIGDTLLGRRDSAGLWDLESIECQVTADASDVLFVETARIDQDQSAEVFS